MTENHAVRFLSENFVSIKIERIENKSFEILNKHRINKQLF